MKQKIKTVVCSNAVEFDNLIQSLLDNDPQYKDLCIDDINDAQLIILADALKSNYSLISLGLRDNRIGAGGAIAIAEALKLNKSLTGLDLRNTNIGVEGAVAIAHSLRVNNSVADLELSQNNIGAGGAIAIAEALKVNNSVTDLYIYNNDIGDVGAVAIAKALKLNKSVTSLRLGVNNIGDGGAIAIAKALKLNKSVTDLDLSYNRIGAGGVVAIVKVNKSINSLKIIQNNIGVEGAIAIAEALKLNNSLTSLNLGVNNIGDGGAIAIAKALKLNKSVTSLDLGNNRIGDRGAVAIADSLRVNKYLTSLRLGVNDIRDGGAIAIAEALKLNKSVISLNLNNGSIGARGAFVIAEALKLNNYITDLTLYNKTPETKALLERNKKIFQDAALSFFKGEILSHEQIEILAVNSLNLSGYIFDPWSKEDAARFVRNLELNVLGDITIRDAAGYIGEYFSKTDVIELAQLYKTPAEKYFGDGVRINEQDERRFNEVYKYSIKLKEVLDLPNNRVFIRDKLKAGGTLNEMIDNLESIIKSGSPFLEIVDKEPKTLGYLMCLSEDVLRKTSDLLTSERSFRDFVIKNPKQIANIVRNLQGAENLESFQHRNDLSEKSGFLKRVIEEGGNSRKKAKTDEGQSRG